MGAGSGSGFSPGKGAGEKGLIRRSFSERENVIPLGKLRGESGCGAEAARGRVSGVYEYGFSPLGSQPSSKPKTSFHLLLELERLIEPDQCPNVRKTLVDMMPVHNFER